MAISAVQLFQPQPLDGVAQLLSGGNNVLAQALSNAVQIGRDSASLRATQEKEVLAERERLDNLAQRRAEQFDKNFQIDRAFNQSVAQDSRDFAEGVRRDQRNFDYGVQRDERNYLLQEQQTIANILNAEQDNTLNKERFNLEKENLLLKKDALRKEADILTAPPKEPSFISKLFGVDNTPPPEDSVRNGTRTVEIGRLLGDPTLIEKGSAMVSQGTQSILQRKEDIRNTPRQSRASSAKSKGPTLDVMENIAEKDAAVIGIPKDKLLSLSLPDISKLLNGDTVNGITSQGEFTDAQRDRVLLNIQNLLKARTSGAQTAPGSTTTPAAPAPVSAAQEYLNRVKKK